MGHCLVPGWCQELEPLDVGLVLEALFVILLELGEIDRGFECYHLFGQSLVIQVDSVALFLLDFVV